MKNNLRKNLFIFAIFALYAFSGFAAKTENSSYAEILSAYQSGFYPGVIKYAEKFQKSYPNSANKCQVLVLQGESHFRLSQFDEALKVLQKAQPLASASNEMAVKIDYWLGRTFFELKDFSSAQKYLYLSASHSKNDAKDSQEAESIYSYSVYFAGKACYFEKDFLRSAMLLENAAANGRNYTMQEFQELLITLLSSWEKLGNNKKISEFYSNYGDGSAAFESFSDFTKNRIRLYAGDAECALENYEKAYSLYEKVLSEADSSLSLAALQKAYFLSSNFPQQVKKDPGEILLAVENKFSEKPEVLDEFYLRLGIDFFNVKDYSKALTYLGGISKNADIYILNVKALYTAQIMVLNGFGPVSVRAEEAEKLLLSRFSSVKEKDLRISWYKQLARFEGLQEKWSGCLEYLSKIPDSMDASCNYWQAFSLYNLKKYPQALSSLEKIVENEPVWKNSTESRILYALVLAKNNRMQDACNVFAGLEENKALSDEMRLNYVRILIESSKNEQAFALAEKIDSTQAVYFQALAKFNLNEWSESALLFEKYLAGEKSDTKQKTFALFYQGYALFRNLNFSQSCDVLLDFASRYSNHELVWNALITAAHAASQNSDFEKAQFAAESALGRASDEVKKQESVTLCASIYSDSKNYAKAEALLSPYLKQSDAFALQCSFSLAQIYALQNKIKEADSVYSSLKNKKSDRNISEEAVYRRGELFYSVNDFKTASSRFSEYTMQFPYGRFYDSALFYEAECQSELQQTEKALLKYELLVRNFPASSYRYPALKKLCMLYRQSQDYPAALSYARKILAEYGTQAIDDKIDIQEKELQKLAGGEDVRIVEKQTEYENAGALTTFEGRKAGTELAELFAQDETTKQQAVSLAQRLLPLQKKNLEQEHEFAAKNAFFLASYNRGISKNIESAELYLEAAQYFRMGSNENFAAASLYGAVEAFDACGKFANAKETAALLNSLYPESPQNEGARRIIDRN